MFGSIIPPLCLLEKEPAYVALGNWHSPEALPKGQNGKALLSAQYLQHPGKNWLDGTYLLLLVRITSWI